MKLALTYEDRRGASVMRWIEAKDATRELAMLRRPARLERDDLMTGPVLVGGVEQCDNADDQRIRWQWWLDRAAIGDPGHRERKQGR